MRGWSIDGLDTSAADVESAIDRAVADNAWLMLSFHDIVSGAPLEATDFNEGEFGGVVDYVRSLQRQGKVKVRTIGDAVARHC